MEINKEFIQNFKASMGSKYVPLYGKPIFERILHSFYKLCNYKKFDICYEDIRSQYLEDLQEWEYLISFLPKQEVKKEENGNRLRDLYLKEQELMKMQLEVV